MSNPLRERLEAGEATIGGWLSIGDSFSAEVMAKAGFDWLLVDLQHGVVDTRDMVPMLQAIGATPTVPLVRPPSNEAAIIGRCLDAGARGVIIPMVNSREDAEAAVAACRFAPIGSRSVGPVRATVDLGIDLGAYDDTESLCIVMLETVEAYDQIDDILSVPGLDGAFVGPGDLSVSFGLSPGLEQDDEHFNSAIEKLLDACNRFNLIPGVFADAEVGRKRLAQGFKMVQIATDFQIMAAAAQEAIETARK